MTHVQTCSRWIGKHIEHIVFLLRLILCHLVRLVLGPGLLPFLLDFTEIVIHFYLVLFLFSFHFLTPVFMRAIDNVYKGSVFNSKFIMHRV